MVGTETVTQWLCLPSSIMLLAAKAEQATLKSLRVSRVSLGVDMQWRSGLSGHRVKKVFGLQNCTSSATSGRSGVRRGESRRQSVERLLFRPRTGQWRFADAFSRHSRLFSTWRYSSENACRVTFCERNGKEMLSWNVCNSRKESR